jgi:hypothetical protein
MRVAHKVSDYPITFLITNSGDELRWLPAPLTSSAPNGGCG